MESTVFIKKYSENQMPSVNEAEVWRYAGYKGEKGGINDELKAELTAVKEDLQGKFSYSVCFIRTEKSYPLETKSAALEKMLDGCFGTVIFAATVGLETDRYIARMQKISPTRALLANALGAERIETLCDTFCGELRTEFACENIYLTKRFSAGYGDLPLSAQKEFFNLLDISRKIGVSLNDSLLMSPSKSVTAIMGLKKTECDNTHTDKCEKCNSKNCQFRKQDNI